MFKNKLALLILSASASFGQVYTATVTAGGSGYSTAPSITASGGGCSTQPTLTSTVSAGALASIVPTFAGSGCTSAPALAIGGPGTGATGTAALIPATIAVLSTTPVVSAGGAAAVGATDLAWQFACELTVPAARVAYYATNNPFRMPGTSQTTSFYNAPAAFQGALTLGIFTEFVDYTYSSSTQTLANVEADMVTRCTNYQTNMNTWNPWANYGTRYFNGTWTPVVGQ